MTALFALSTQVTLLLLVPPPQVAEQSLQLPADQCGLLHEGAEQSCKSLAPGTNVQSDHKMAKTLFQTTSQKEESHFLEIKRRTHWNLRPYLIAEA